MIKKHYVLWLVNVLVAVAAVYGFNHWQNTVSLLQLNNHNLSQKAVMVTTKKSNITVNAFTKLVSKSALDNVQVQLISKKQKNLTYFWGKGNYATPAMSSGRFFSESDFTALEPVAVVGKNLKSKLYTPKDQSYIKINGQYIPVIGIMGGKYKSNLDNQIFVAGAIESFGKTTLKNYTIWLDSSNLKLESTVKKALSISHVKHTSLVKINNQKHTSVDYKAIGLLGVLVLVMLSTIWGWLKASWLLQVRLLDKFERSVFVFRNWGAYTAYSGVGMVVGVMIGGIFIKLTSYLGVLIYLGCVLASCSAIMYLYLSKASNLLKVEHAKQFLKKIKRPKRS